MRSLTTHVLAAGVSILASTSAFSQYRQPDWRGNGNWNGNGRWDRDLLQGHTDGRGELRINGRCEKTLDGVDVVLGGDGRAQIRFQGNGGAPFYGYWSGRGDRKTIRIDDGIGDRDTMGSGMIEIDRNMVRSIEMSGRRNRDRWSVSFRGEERRWGGNGNNGGWGNGGRDDNGRGNGGWGNGNGNWGNGNGGYDGNCRPTSAIIDGYGYVDYRRNRNDFDRCYVNLQSNGQFEVRFSGRGGTVFSGRWTPNRDYADLNVNDGFGRGRADGRGRVYFDSRGKISSVDLSGSCEGSGYSVRFGQRR